ncbi:hypothetical protein D3C81_1088250 [compost metagenome]
MVVNQKLEHFHRVAAVNIERPIQKLDRLRPIVDKVHNIRFDPFNIIVTDTYLDT